MTSTPRLRAPSAKARASSGLESRMSWPMTQAGVALAWLPVLSSWWSLALVRRCRVVVVVVVAEDDDLGEGRSEGAGDPGVELVRDDAADVVGLHDVGEGDRSHGWRAYGSSGARTGCGLVRGRPPGRRPSGVDGRVAHRRGVPGCGGPPSPAAIRRRRPGRPRACAGLWRAALPAATSGVDDPVVPGACARVAAELPSPARRPSGVDGRIAQGGLRASCWAALPRRPDVRINGPSPTSRVRARDCGRPAVRGQPTVRCR